MNQFTQAVEALKRKKIIKYDSDVSRDLSISKSIVSEYKKFRPLNETFIEQFNNQYGKHGIKLSMDDTIEQFQSAKNAHSSQGRNPSPPPSLDSGQLAHMILSNSSVSLASYELLCRAVAILENKPIEKVVEESNRVVHDKMTTFEKLLKEMISLP